MERYAPVAKDLASRDVVSRSMTLEIREGRCVRAHMHACTPPFSLVAVVGFCILTWADVAFVCFSTHASSHPALCSLCVVTFAALGLSFHF